MKYKQIFYVKGSGWFPFDMLRYDQCWPAYEQESTLLGSEDFESKETLIALERHVMTRDEVPTLNRWESFGWEVVPESIVNIRIR